MCTVAAARKAATVEFRYRARAGARGEAVAGAAAVAQATAEAALAVTEAAEGYHKPAVFVTHSLHAVNIVGRIMHIFQVREIHKSLRDQVQHGKIRPSTGSRQPVSLAGLSRSRMYRAAFKECQFSAPAASARFRIRVIMHTLTCPVDVDKLVPASLSSSG
jgi:hypothetical protein